MTVELDREDGVARVTLSRPERHNALDSETLEALADALVDAEDADALVLRGAGESFSSGADVRELVGMDVADADAYAARAQRATRALAEFPAPSVAAIDGYCLGGGWELALCCDLRVASTEAVVGYTEVDLSVVPAWGGLHRLVRLVDDETARRLVFFGDRVDAQDAHELGLVGDVVAADQLDEYVADTVSDLTDKPAFALRAAKSAIEGAYDDPDAARQRQRRLWSELFGTDEPQKAMRSFLD